MKELLTEAEKENRAVGSFSVHSMKNVKGEMCIRDRDRSLLYTL